MEKFYFEYFLRAVAGLGVENLSEEEEWTGKKRQKKRVWFYEVVYAEG